MTIFPQTRTPLTIPGCVGWLDAADTSTITSSGGAVSSVRNKANSRIPFIQGTGANQPTTGTRTLSGNNVLDFDGSTDYMSADGLADYFTTGTKPVTFFQVVAPDISPPAVSRAIFSTNSGTGRYFSSFLRPSTGLMDLGSQNDAGNYKDVTTSAALVSAISTLLVTVYGGSTSTNYQNATTVNTAIATSNGVITLNGFQVGSIGTSFCWDGIIAELIIYNRALSDAERITIMRYLGNKWGIVVP